MFTTTKYNKGRTAETKKEDANGNEKTDINNISLVAALYP